LAQIRSYLAIRWSICSSAKSTSLLISLSLSLSAISSISYILASSLIWSSFKSVSMN